MITYQIILAIVIVILMSITIAIHWKPSIYLKLLDKYKNWFKYNWQNYLIMAAHLFLDFLFLLLILLTIG